MHVYYTACEAARVLGCSPRTLEKWRCYGGGPTYYKMGRAVRYAKRDLEDWLADRRVFGSPRK